MFDLTGKGALVTGATGGIGGEIARALKAQGAKVAISGTRADRLTALAAEIGDVTALPCNLKDREAVGSLFGEAEAALGSVDIIVNNAGITRDNIFMRMKDEEWDEVIAVNLTATFILCRTALRTMMRKRYGRIINIASVSGVVGNPGQGNYAASKAGMIGMSKALAAEVASRNVTVNCVAPGMVETAMTDALSEAQRARILAQIPAGRLGQVQEVAAACVFLASEESAYVTGQTLHVNGGMAMI